MKVIRCHHLSLVLVLIVSQSFAAIIPDNAPLPPAARKRRDAAEDVPIVADKRQSADSINFCFDCDSVCAQQIAKTKYSTPNNYFAEVLNQINFIFSSSKLPLAANLKLLTVVNSDIVLDPTGSTLLQAAMDAYWRPKNVDISLARISQRMKSGCAISFLVTDDPIFSRNANPAGLAYVNSLCTNWGYSISQWTVDIPTEAARIAHELAHSMYINHIAEGDISFPSDTIVKLQCYPDVCRDPSGNCITVAQMTKPAPTMYSKCARAIFYTWRLKGYGSCLGDMVTFTLDDASGGA